MEDVMQLIIEEQTKKKLDQQAIEYIRIFKEKLGLTTQQAMDVMKIPPDKQDRYRDVV